MAEAKDGLPSIPMFTHFLIEILKSFFSSSTEFPLDNLDIEDALVLNRTDVVKRPSLFVQRGTISYDLQGISSGFTGTTNGQDVTNTAILSLNPRITCVGGRLEVEKIAEEIVTLLQLYGNVIADDFKLRQLDAVQVSEVRPFKESSDSYALDIIIVLRAHRSYTYQKATPALKDIFVKIREASPS